MNTKMKPMNKHAQKRERIRKEIEEYNARIARDEECIRKAMEKYNARLARDEERKRIYQEHKNLYLSKSEEERKIIRSTPTSEYEYDEWENELIETKIIEQGDQGCRSCRSMRFYEIREDGPNYLLLHEECLNIIFNNRLIHLKILEECIDYDFKDILNTDYCPDIICERIQWIDKLLKKNNLDLNILLRKNVFDYLLSIDIEDEDNEEHYEKQKSFLFNFLYELGYFKDSEIYSRKEYKLKYKLWTNINGDDEPL